MDRKVFHTDKAPAAIGPYSQAVQAGGFLFVSGQIPIDPSTGKIVKSDIKTQTRQVLNNVKAIVENAGSGLDRIVKTEVFLANMEEFSLMNEVYADFFKGDMQPARQAVEASRLPKDSLIEISCVALI